MTSIISCITTLVLGLFSLRPSDIPYLIKWIATYIYLRIYKYLYPDRMDFYDLTLKEKPEKVGFLTHPTETKLESPCPESHLKRGDDKIFCYGINSKGECLVVSIARLNNEKAESTIFLRLATGKTYKLEYTSDFQQPNNEKHVFSCGGLQMYYLCPMRRWRIFFSGYLKETSEDNENGLDSVKMTYVKFSFLWRASSDVYDNTADMNKGNIIESVAKSDWQTVVPPVNKLINVLDFYAQAGVIMGTVYVEDTEDYELYLFGERLRYLDCDFTRLCSQGDMSFSKETDFSVTLGYVHRDGTYVHFGNASSTNISKNTKFGYMVLPNAEMKNIESVDVSETSEADKQEMKGTIVAGRSYAFCGSVLRPVVQASDKEKSLSINQIQFYLNGRKGTGVNMKGKFRISSPRRMSDVETASTVPEHMFPKVVSFDEELCQLPEITGGKGSSLGKLTHFSMGIQTFTVPSGLVVTTSSYKEFISEDILKEIRNLENVLYGKATGNVKGACKRVEEKIVNTKMPNNIISNITKNLKKIFGENYMSKKFAVRSSATGEDTEQMSAAGQMDTYLGISGLNKILLAVKKCWASQFGFTAIQYKRRYGQCLNSPMAVVIQEMVSCDVAGVVFTCDPVSGNPTKMSIAANFGLGESVVSGSEEPDTIELARNHKNELTIHRMTVGSKKHKIVEADAGTRLEDIPESERQESCLSEEKALTVGKIAMKIEKYYRSRRDIEWGFKNDVLYVFQSRPVTSGTQETDFEIEHEMDGPLRVEGDHFSVSNSGEVLPGAMTPFGVDVFFRMSYISWQGPSEVEWQIAVKTRYFPISWMNSCNHVMFNIEDMFSSGVSKEKNPFVEATMVAFFGRILEDEEIFQTAEDRYSLYSKPKSWKQPLLLFKNLILSGFRLKKSQKKYTSYRIPIEKFKTSKDLLHAITLHCCDLNEAMMTHMICSQGSTFWNMTILTTLSQARDGIDNDVYADFANLITNRGDVESADVPAAIQSLAFHIRKSIQPQKFKAMKTEEALNWLKTTPASAGKMFKEFMLKHGHRCVKEFDFYSKTWGSDPEPLVKLLQNLAGNVTEDVASIRNTSIFKLISQLKVPIGFLSKLKLMLLVPLSRRSVQERESSKSALIRGIDAWRKAFRGLARMMVAEGRLPNEDIMFFMTLEELKELVESRSPKIIAKAYHRQRLYPKMDQYIFPEIMKGFPRPINYDSEEVEPEEGDFSMRGIPVSQGVAKGYVRVAITLDDAAYLKPGEIMLAYSTDIGWTPYFPTLAGVGTELGGLISHGAVVSREYGLPCIAGLHGATRRFRTGDYVLLDGNKGIIQKLPPPEDK